MVEISTQTANIAIALVAGIIGIVWVLMFIVPLVASVVATDNNDPTPIFLAIPLFIILWALQANLTFNIYNPMVEALPK